MWNKMLTAAMSQNIKGREKGKGRRMVPNRRWCMFTTIRRYLVLQSIKMIPSGELLTKTFQKRKTVKDNGDQALTAPQDWWLKINFTCGQNRTIGWPFQTIVGYLSKLNLNKSAQIIGKNEWTMRKEVGCSDVGLGKKIYNNMFSIAVHIFPN